MPYEVWWSCPMLESGHTCAHHFHTSSQLLQFASQRFLRRSSATFEFGGAGDHFVSRGVPHVLADRIHVLNKVGPQKVCVPFHSCVQLVDLVWSYLQHDFLGGFLSWKIMEIWIWFVRVKLRQVATAKNHIRQWQLTDSPKWSKMILMIPSGVWWESSCSVLSVASGHDSDVVIRDMVEITSNHHVLHNFQGTFEWCHAMVVHPQFFS